MDIIITGGTGFIGGLLCRRLVEQGHQVRVLSREPETAGHRIGCSVEASRTLEVWQHEPVDSIVNLAGAPIADARWTEARKKLLIDSRVEITRQLLDFIERAEHKPNVMVSGSAVGYYGDQGERDVTEETPPTQEFSHELCRQWEEEAQRAEDLGVRVCRVRTGLVLGLGGGPLAKMLLPFKLGLGGRIGHGRQYMSWVHRKDIVRIIEFLLEREDLSGAFNGTAPHPVTNAAFAHALARELHRPAILPMPAPVLKLMLGRELAHILLTGAKVLPHRLQQAGFEFEYPRLPEALADVLQ